MKLNDFIKREWYLILLVLLPYIAAPFLWDLMPEEVPIHWDFEGNPDSWAHKSMTLLIIPGMSIIMYALFILLPRFDPKWKNYKMFADSYFALRVGMLLFMFLIYTVAIVITLGYDLNVGMFVMYLIALLFLFLGNMFSRFRHNYFVGIRTPWTLNNEEVWTRTHRFAGKIWVYPSLFMVILGIFLDFVYYRYVFIVYVSIIVIVPIVYSYLIYKKLGGDDKEIVYKDDDK